MAKLRFCKVSRVSMLLAVAALSTGCVSVASNSAVCDGTAAARTAHAAALAQDASDAAVVTGARLIRLIDAACG